MISSIKSTYKFFPEYQEISVLDQAIQSCIDKNSLTPLFVAFPEFGPYKLPPETKAPFVMVTFFRGMFQTAIRGLSFFNDTNRPGTVWDCYLLLDLYLKVLLLPKTMIVGSIALTGGISTGVMIGTAATVAILGFVYLYMKSPMPYNCPNLSAMKRIETTGRQEEINQIVRATLSCKRRPNRKDRHVLLQAKTGSGKSRCLHGAVDELFKRAPHLKVIDATPSFAARSTDHQSTPLTRLQEIISQLGDEAENAVLIYDDKTVTTEMFDFLEKTPVTLWVATEHSFSEAEKSRFRIIDLKSNSEELVKAMIAESKLLFKVSEATEKKLVEQESIGASYNLLIKMMDEHKDYDEVELRWCLSETLLPFVERSPQLKEAYDKLVAFNPII